VNHRKHILNPYFPVLAVLLALLMAGPLAAQNEGSLRITSEISGTVLIGGDDTGVRVKALDTVRLRDLTPGMTEVAIWADDGQQYPAFQNVTIMPGQTVEVMISAGMLWDIDIREDGAVITGFKGHPGPVIIPAVINGLPVIGIERDHEYNFGIFHEKRVTNVTIPASIATMIGDGAFAYNDLVNVTIPPTIGGIGPRAFAYNRLASVNIPLSVTYIGGRAFANNRLTRVNIPKWVEFIGSGAFAGNPQLAAFSVDSANSMYTGIEGVLFSKDKSTIIAYPGGKGNHYTVPRRVTAIADEAFTEIQLTSITFSSGVTSIGERAFAGNQLTEIDFPSRIRSIGRGAFEGNLLIRVTLPSSLAAVGERMFANNRLTRVTFPANLTVIDARAFMNNDLSGITFPSKLKTIGFEAFSGNRLTSVTLPASVTTVDRRAFVGNRITSVTIGANVSFKSDAGDSDREEYSAFPNGFDTFYNSTGKRAGTYTYVNSRWNHRN
jgi:hypothetical protein